jgi:hypothetical protein
MNGEQNLILANALAGAKGTCRRCSFSATMAPHLVCRRNPPQVQVFLSPAPPPRINDVQLNVQSHWPIVQPSEWCGEFRARRDVGEVEALPAAQPEAP